MVMEGNWWVGKFPTDAYLPRVRMGERLDRFRCWCLGHRWVPRTFHDTQGAHDFVVCTRCGKVSERDAEGRGLLERWM